MIERGYLRRARTIYFVKLSDRMRNIQIYYSMIYDKMVIRQALTPGQAHLKFSGAVHADGFPVLAAAGA